MTKIKHKEAMLLFKRSIVALSFYSFFSLNASAQNVLDPSTQPKFVNPLPMLSSIDMTKGGKVTIDEKPMQQWLGVIDTNTKEHLLTNMWGYNGTFPGPTILAKKNTPIYVNWNNALTGITHHLLPVDTSIMNAFMGTNYSFANNGIPLVTHLHGGHTDYESDGYPDAWYTPNYALTGPFFTKKDYYYKNDQEAATLWYHDHVDGFTRVNVMAGLAGAYKLTDDNELALKASNILPSDSYDIPLFLQDRQFTSDGQIFYPSDPKEFYGRPYDTTDGLYDADAYIDPVTKDSVFNKFPKTSLIPEFFGRFMLVNGMTWPVMEVEPRQYSFRIIDGSDSRMYNMKLISQSDYSLDNVELGYNGFKPGLQGVPLLQVGTDDGLLPKPALLDSMFIAPGERKEIVIDFSKFAGQTFILANNAMGPYPDGDTVDEQSSQIMMFKVTKPLNTNNPLSTVTTTSSLRPDLKPLVANVPVRKVILKEVRDEFGRLRPSLGTPDMGAMQWMDSTTENVKLGDTEMWEIYDETGDAHPIHIHSVSLQLVNRQQYTATQSSADSLVGILHDIKMVGAPILPTDDEKGWKDTWIVQPGQVMRLIAHYDIPGHYVWHCHILSHEDHDMMRPMEVVTNYWTGAVSTDWNNAANWSDKVVPTSTTSIVIPTPPINQPVISGDVAIGGITLDGSIDLNGNSLTVNGDISGPGFLKGSSTSSLTVAGNGSILYFDTAHNSLKNLTINVPNGTVTLGNHLFVYGTVNQDSGSFVTANNLTLVLPVIGLKASALVTPANEVKIKWSILAQKDIASFSIEHSLDGVTFKTLETQKISSNQLYEYKDANPTNGINYYRVKATSYKGETTYSNVVTVKLIKNNYINVYPNPIVGNSFYINFNSLMNGNYKIRIISKLGQTVSTQSITHNQPIEMVRLPQIISSGIYAVLVTDEDGITHKADIEVR